MKKLYREATDTMEQKGVDPDYIIGWQGGFLNHPLREEQRATEAYKAGYEDGRERVTDNFDKWVAK